MGNIFKQIQTVANNYKILKYFTDLIFGKHQRAIGSSKAKAVGNCDTYFLLLCCFWYKIKGRTDIWSLKIQCRRYDVLFFCQYG